MIIWQPPVTREMYSLTSHKCLRRTVLEVSLKLVARATLMQVSDWSATPDYPLGKNMYSVNGCQVVSIGCWQLLA